MRRSSAILALATGVIGACSSSHPSLDDDDVSSDEWDAEADRDADSAADPGAVVDGGADAESDADSGSDIELRGLGLVWTEALAIDTETVCAGLACEGPDLVYGGGEGQGHCAARTGFEGRWIIANCGDQSTAVSTTFALYYGPENVDPRVDATILSEGLVPGLDPGQAVAVHFVLSDDEWSTAVAPAGYFVTDPLNRVAECYEATNIDGGALAFLYTCR